MLAVLLLIWRQQNWTGVSMGSSNQVNLKSSSSSAKAELGPRHQLSYLQWLDILKQEAKVTAQKTPQHLTILAGDSLSLWFPPELLPEGKYWLNQGISGETSHGLLKRLDLFDQTQPETILVMIGINDLIQGVSDEIVLDDQRQILTYLRKIHPQTQIILQSILPHGGEESTWEGRDKLLVIPNQRISRLNKRLQSIATKKSVKYLDLYPLFSNQQGNLRRELTTDGLHLSYQGYIVWRTALQIYGSGEWQSRTLAAENK